MNILIVSTSNAGGAAKCAFRLFEAIKEHGAPAEVKILTLRGKHDPDNRIYTLNGKTRPGFIARQKQRIAAKEYIIKRIPNAYETFDLPITGFQVEDHPLVKWADVINLHFVAGMVNVRSFFRKVSVPVFWTLHDLHPFSGGYHFEEKFPKALFERWIEIGQRITKEAVKEAPLTIVGQNKWMIEKSKQSYPFSSLKHLSIDNSLNVNTFRLKDEREIAHKIELPNDRFKILFVSDSVTNERKGVATLLAIMPELSQSLDATVLTIGRHRVESTNDNIINIGHVGSEDTMADIYNQADLFVIPSIEDNMPNTVMESLCCGTPVVGFQIGGLPDMIDPGENGYLAEKGDAESLKKNILKAASQKWDKAAISEQAKERFDPKRQAKSYISAFSEALNT